MKYFENGEVVKLKNNNGEDFDVRILNRVCDYYGDGKMYYIVEPVRFEGFRREVLCKKCYKEKKND